MIDDIVQGIILLMGAAAIYGIVERKVWGWLLGFLAQPLWIYAAYTADQWGILVLDVWYTACYWWGYQKTKEENDEHSQEE